MLICGFAFGCQPDTSSDRDDLVKSPVTPAPQSGYGEEQIGFRNGQLAEEGGDLSSGANRAPSPASSDDAQFEYDGAPAPEGELSTPPPAEPTFSAFIDADTLERLRGEEAQWGFVYEGLSNGARGYELQRSWWLNLEGTSYESEGDLTVNYSDGAFFAAAQTYLGTSSDFTGPVQLDEYLKVQSKLRLELAEEPSEEPSDLTRLDQGAETVVIRETYQTSPNGRILRESCLIGAQAEDDQGETYYAVQGDELISVPFVSLASVTPLSEVSEIGSEDVDRLLSSAGAQPRVRDDEDDENRSDFEASSGRCQCFDESGAAEINCDEFYRDIDPNIPAEIPFYTTAESPLSTFSLDVDTASYTLVRQALNQDTRPDPSGVRVEEMINYFKYNYALPSEDQPFTVYTEVADCPWNPDSKLAMIGLRGQEVSVDEQPPANLVYLLDVSGSMRQEMWLIKPAFRLLTSQLRPQDTLSIVVYAGHDAVALEGVSGDRQDEILAAIESLESGGSTNGEMGIRRAYQIAAEHFKPGGNNRVILATDGDFNVGVNGEEELIALIQEQAESGVFLTVYGFSTNYSGNYKDQEMEALSNHGNGTYFFIDGAAEAQRAFIHSLSGTLLTIAKDVKIQVQFNPELVQGYRLIGYDNRRLNNRDFNDDSVDAGELGNGEEMTAFYELILADAEIEVPVPVRGPAIPPVEGEVEEQLTEEHLMAVRMRYKLPDADESTLFVTPTTNAINSVPSLKFTFASTVAHLGLALRRSAYLPSHDLDEVGAQLAVFGEADLPALNELRALIEAARQLDP